MTILNDPHLERLLDRLHEASDAQTETIREHRDERDRAVDRAPEDQAALTKNFLADKLYALDRDKAEFCYQVCRTIDARRIVEIGTSYGVSTLYLAAAVRDSAIWDDTVEMLGLDSVHRFAGTLKRCSPGRTLAVNICPTWRGSGERGSNICAIRSIAGIKSGARCEAT